MTDTLNHEVMHHFGSYLKFKNPDGSLNSSLLGKDSTHWSYLLDTQGSLMYGNGWKDNGNGTFTSAAVRSSFSPLDLYLMGMIPKEQVPPMLLIDNPAIDKAQMPNLWDTITGAARMVTIDDIIAAEGERIPNTTTAQKQFNVGFVLLTRAGDNATATTQAVETLRKAWPASFAELTQNKGSFGNIPASLDLGIESPADGATVAGPDVTVQGVVLNTTNVETGVTVNGIPATVTGNRFVVNHVPLQAGSNSITITATDINGQTATSTRSVTTGPGHYIRIVSNVESGTLPLETSLRVEGSFKVANLQINTSDSSVVGLPWISETEFGARLTAEGAYTITASAVGPDGQTYTDSVTITAISRTKLENLLKAKWDAMRAALATGNVTTAVANFSEYSKESYRQQFTDLIDSLPQIAAGMTNVSMLKVKDTIAEFDMRDVIDGVTYSFYLLFVKERDGVWRIRNF